MKRTFMTSPLRLLGAATLWSLLLQGASAQQVIQEPSMEFGYGTLNDLHACPSGPLFLASVGEANAPKRLLLFDLETGRPNRRFEPLFDPAVYGWSWVRASAFSADGALLATCEVYHPANEITGDLDEVFLIVRDVSTGTLVRTLAQWKLWSGGNQVSVSSLAWTADSTRLLAGLSVKKIARLYDVESGEVIREFTHPGRINNVAISPNGTRILTGGYRNNLACLWNTSTGEVIQTFPFIEGMVTVAFSPDGQSLLLGNDAVYLHETASGQLIRKFNRPASDDGCGPVAFSPDASHIIASVHFMDQPRITCMWDAATGELLRTLQGGEPSFADGGATMLTRAQLGWEHFAVRAYDPTTGEIIRTIQEFDPSAECVRFSAEGTMVLTAQENSAVLWNAKTGRLIRRLHSGGIWGAFSPDGTEIVLAAPVWDEIGQYYVVRVLNTANGELLRSFSSETEFSAKDAVVSLDHTKIALAGGMFDDVLQIGAGFLDVVDLKTETLLRRFLAGDGEISSVAFSPDGEYVAGGVTLMNDVGPPIRLWHIPSGALVREFRSPADDPMVTAMRFSSDGSRLLTGASKPWDVRGPRARLWNTATGQLLRSFDPGYGNCPAVAFSPDDTKVLSLSRDAVRIWDADTGQLMTTLAEGWINPVGGYWSAAFSPDGRKVLTSSIYGAALLWSLVPEMELNLSRLPSGTLLLTWPNPSGGLPYALQQRLDLSTGGWSDVTVSTPGRYEITEASGRMFYRLMEP